MSGGLVTGAVVMPKLNFTNNNQTVANSVSAAPAAYTPISFGSVSAAVQNFKAKVAAPKVQPKQSTQLAAGGIAPQPVVTTPAASGVDKYLPWVIFGLLTYVVLKVLGKVLRLVLPF